VGDRHAFLDGGHGLCAYFPMAGSAHATVRCGLPADDLIHFDLQAVALTNRPGPRLVEEHDRPVAPRSMPWAGLPLPSKVAGMFLIVGLGIVFLAACAAAAAALLHAGGIL
jgi:hypothetical protein